MAGPTRTEDQRERDLEIVANLYCQGQTLRAIADKIGVTFQQVHYDLNTIRERWQASSVSKIEERKAAELARIDHLEAVAWDAWERSQQPAETTEKASVKGRVNRRGEVLPDQETERKTLRGQTGDPRFLDRVGWCIEQRCKILGILKVEMIQGWEPSPVAGGIDLSAVIGKRSGLPFPNGHRTTNGNGASHN